MTAREFLRIRWAERRQTSFIPIQTFGFAEFEPQRQPVSPCGHAPALALPTAGEAKDWPLEASPAFSPQS